MELDKFKTPASYNTHDYFHEKSDCNFVEHLYLFDTIRSKITSSNTRTKPAQVSNDNYF